MFNTVIPGFKTTTDKKDLNKILANRNEFIASIFNEDNLAQKYSISKKPPAKVNCNVLTSNQTELAGCFYSKE